MSESETPAPVITITCPPKVCVGKTHDVALTEIPKMPKRSRNGSEVNVYPLPPDPLKSVPRSLRDLAEAGNFTVCDLIVVLDEMAKLFKTSISLTRPHEGSIDLDDIPPASWISDKKKRESVNNGLYTELRFSLSKESEELQFIHETLMLCEILRRSPNIETTIVRSCDDDADTIKKRIPYWRSIYRYDRDQVADLLNKPMPLCLRANYPHYTWPRWAFGAFEAFVARRIQLK